MSRNWIRDHSLWLTLPAFLIVLVFDHTDGWWVIFTGGAALASLIALLQRRHNTNQGGNTDA